jgi:HNH endonuclease
MLQFVLLRYRMDYRMNTEDRQSKGSVEIPLRGEKGRGMKAIVDIEDLHLVQGQRWYLSTRGYAQNAAGQQMHRVIMGCTDPNIVPDHSDGERLNNRRSNLSLCTHEKNRKRKVIPLEPTIHPGIYWDRFSRQWAVRLYDQNAQRSVGIYQSIKKAISVCDAEIKHGGLTVISPTGASHRPWVARTVEMILADHPNGRMSATQAKDDSKPDAETSKTIDQQTPELQNTN